MYHLIYIPKNENVLSNVTLDEIEFYLLNQAETGNALDFEVIESEESPVENPANNYTLFV